MCVANITPPKRLMSLVRIFLFLAFLNLRQIGIEMRDKFLTVHTKLGLAQQAKTAWAVLSPILKIYIIRELVKILETEENILNHEGYVMMKTVESLNQSSTYDLISRQTVAVVHSGQ